jgi:integrase
MGKLRDLMLMEMELRNFKPRTIESYLWHMKSFTKQLGRSPAEVGEQEIRHYLYYMKKERHNSWSNINQGYSALKFFYVQTLHRAWNVDKIPRPKGEHRLPRVLSQQEVTRFLDATSNLKYRVIFMTIYSGGLRLSEAAHLKIADIDSGRMQIRINQGKGNKDRYTLLSKRLLTELRPYWHAYRPTTWLFPGRHNKPLSVSSIQVAFGRSKKKPTSQNQLLSILYAIVSQPIF